jgi:hypothetical protein
MRSEGDEAMGEPAAGPLILELLPARHGDAILLAWGAPADRHSMLIDGGPASAYPKVSERLREALAEEKLELLVLTHIDADHIEGALLLTNDADLDIVIEEFWFNGPAQVAPKLSAAQGEMLAALIGARGIPLNSAFDKAAVRVPDGSPPPVHHLPGGLTLTILGPDGSDLAVLRASWLSTFGDGRLNFATEQDALSALRARTRLNPGSTFLSGDPAPPSITDLLQKTVSKDTSPANRSSIVLLVEYAGITVLLPGDATPAALTAGVRRLLEDRDEDRLELTAFKLPHHGSARNVTRELLELLPAEHYLFSSDGGQFGHPDDAGVASCLAYGRPGSALVFNYRNPRTLRWQNNDLLNHRGNSAIYPSGRNEGVTVSMPAPENGH